MLALGHRDRFVPISGKAFVAKYSGPKRARYESGRLTLLHSPLCSRDARIKGFVKVEATDGLSKDPDPRLISTRDPRYGLELGRFLSPVEHEL